MDYMVIETFLSGPDPVYRRVAEQGRMLPEGVEYIQSWVTTDKTRCYQLMRTDDPELFKEWTARWDDIVGFEIVGVMGSADAITQISGQTPD